MSAYIKLLTLIIFTLFIYACSNESTSNQAQTAQTNETGTQEIEIEEKYDFRKTKWGMSIEEVKESEDTEPIEQSKNTLDYSTLIYGREAQIGYTFNNDELIRAGLFFIPDPDTIHGDIDNYLTIKDELTKVNGKPVLDTVKQKDPSKKIDPENNREAVCNGDILYAAQWDLPATDIQLLLRGENSNCMLTILYVSEEGLRKLLQERANQK